MENFKISCICQQLERTKGGKNFSTNLATFRSFLIEIRQNSKIGALIFNQHLLTYAAEQSAIWQHRLKRRLMQPISYYWTNNYMLLKNHHHTMLEININKEYSVKQKKMINC